ncbi:MAG: STAS domain-containing protein [Microthrixaceae bacterium]
MHFPGHRSEPDRDAHVSVDLSDPSLVSIRIAGDLDHAGTRSIEHRFQQAIAQARGAVHVASDQVTFVDSAGLRMLLQGQMMAADRSLEYRLVNPAPPLTRLLQISGLDDLLESAIE